MADSVDRVFVHALNTVKKLPRSGSSRPPPEDRMKLYGLYKQSMEGDVDGMVQRPTGTSDQEIMEARKWDSWHEQKGLSKTEAKRRYITTLIDAMHRYAITTPDARELVSELEFVWDQIKSNQHSSSSASPTTPGQQRGNSQQPSSAVSAASVTTQRRHPLGLSHSQSVSAAGLQILPPMSPTDDSAARFTTFPAIGMGVQTDDEEAGHRADNDHTPEDDDDDDDGDEHYETMDEFDENGLPKVTVINEPAVYNKDPAVATTTTAAGILSPARSVRTQTIAVDNDTPRRKLHRQPPSSHHSQPLTATRRSTAAALSSSSSAAAAAAAAASRTPNPHSTTQNYARWKQRVEVALTKMTAELAAMREQLDVARTSAATVNVNIPRGRLNWLRRWISWGVWLVVKHLFVDAVVLGVLVVWMRRRGDRRVEHVVSLLSGFLGERLRLRRGDTPEVTRTFVVA
ncbi:hypothetical protein TWF696_004069 [Orbilia brochopaga]|uniref:ACB domain-containing protein n=1 Tax=Orbilia brochopaga TaxID=3140254 RepID=A0AAV9V510_9PEZI